MSHAAGNPLLPRLALALAFQLLAGAGAVAAPTLSVYLLEADQSSVSGVSAGAFMAVQFHVAFSRSIRGVGIVAGGPYHCTRGRVWGLRLALRQCTWPLPWLPQTDVDRLFADAQRFARAGEIDGLANLIAARVYAFSGANDYVVSATVLEQAMRFYRLAGVPAHAIRYVRHPGAGHALLTERYGNPCAASAPPFINACDYDQAGAILQHIYGHLNPPVSAAAAGRILEFSQAEFIEEPHAHGMSAIGYAYVPDECARGARCKAHIAFHGCGQTTEAIGDLFYRRAGYNEWAGANRIVVLYPQLVRLTWKNPQGCWDWWGYDSARYYSKQAPQMLAVMAMLRRLTGRE